MRKWLHHLGTSSDQGYAGQTYLERARQGWQLIAVYAATAKQADQIACLLSSYHVTLMKYIRLWGITDFHF